MYLRRSFNHIPKRFQQGALTIGKFDGIHLGHQELLKNLTHYATQHNLPSIMIIFEPRPVDYFNSPYQQRITQIREQLLLIKQAGIDLVICQPFNQTVADMPAIEFINDILIKRLKIRKLWVGKDFRFGKGRQGDFQLLSQMANQQHFKLEVIPTCFNQQQQRIASSNIRQQLSEGNITQVNQQLNRPLRISGFVRHGQALGAKIGFPTANINLQPKNIKQTVQSLKRGVYFVTVKHNSRIIPAAANIGIKPTINHQALSLEVHLIDFSGNLYGSRLIIDFHQFIREEQKFASIEDLKQQISMDTNTCHKLWQKLAIID